jgi:endonuclease-3 related protein
MSRQKLMDIYERLYRHYGPQGWWPGQTPFETIIGAILTQNTNWNNVERALENLRTKAGLTPERLHRMTVEEIALLIRPAGYFNLKARRLKCFLDWLFETHDGAIQKLQSLPASTLRRQLLAIKGIGPETADSICLYAFDKPVFVVDAYTARILGRHGLLEPGCGYQDIQDLFHSCLDRDAQLFNEYHALLVRLGKDHCRRKPICAGCPLEDLPRYLESEMQ